MRLDNMNLHLMIAKKSLFASLFLLLCLGLSSCYDIQTPDSIEVENLQAEYAIPIIDTYATILDIGESTGENTSIEVDEEGRVTVFYNGNVIRNSTPDIFPPVPGFLIGEFNLEQPETELVLEDLVPFEGGFILKKATFKNNGLVFRLRSDVQEEVSVEVTIPQITKDGIAFSASFVINENGNWGEEILSELIDLNDFTLESDDNTLTINTTAQTASGNPVALDVASMTFNILQFSYVEGFFTKNDNNESGDVITVGVYSTWISGGLDFEDPKLTVEVENSFGFPVRGLFNKLEFTTINDDKFDIMGTAIDAGFDFNYPGLNEVGQVATSQFLMDKNNSNLSQIFNEKVRLVRYDVNAIGNPDDDSSIIGFLTDSSYYNVDIAVELPLQAKINQLVLSDTFDLNIPEYDLINHVELLLTTENNFPFEMKVQGYLINGNEIIDSLFLEEAYTLPAAQTTNGIVSQSSSSTSILPFDNARWTDLLSSDKIAMTARFTNEAEDDITWIYKDYGLDMKLGAKIYIQK